MDTHDAGEQVIRLVAHQHDGKLVPKKLYEYIIKDRLGRNHADMWHEDVFQEVLLALLEKERDGTLRDVLSYASRVSHGKAIDQRRKEQRRAHASLDADVEGSGPFAHVASPENTQPESVVEARERLRLIAKAADELAPGSAPRVAYERRARWAFDEDLVKEEFGANRLPGAHRQAWSEATKHIQRRLDGPEAS